MKHTLTDLFGECTLQELLIGLLFWPAVFLYWNIAELALRAVGI